jgi:cytochrome b561
MMEMTTGWSLRARLFHWLSALAVAVQLVIGFILLGGMAMAGSLWLVVHLSLGLTVLGLTVVRLGSRFFDTAPNRLGPRPLAAMAFLGHAGLYILLLLVPLSGWLGYRPAPFMPPPLLFGYLPMPVLSNLVSVSPRTMLQIHSLSSWALLILVGLHILAAFIHYCILGDGDFKGMVSGRRKAPAVK